MLGHPTGRLLLAREGYDVDLDAVIGAACAAGTMIEINANPIGSTSTRPPLPGLPSGAWGVGIVVNPDAHATSGLSDLDYGIGVARRAGLTPDDVFNAAAPAAVSGALKSRRERWS